MRFRLEFPQNGTTNYSHRHPADVFLDNQDPLVAAYIAPQEDALVLDPRLWPHVGPDLDIAKGPHYGSADDSIPTLDIRDLAAPQPFHMLAYLELAATLVKVTEWEELEFNNLRLGTHDILKCGPFELSAFGHKARFSIGAGAGVDFRDEHTQYRQRVPLHFLNHSYAMTHIRILDSRGRELEVGLIMGQGIGSVIDGGCSFSDFSIRSRDGSLPKLIDGHLFGEEIEYPVTIKVKLPKRYEKDRIKFRMENITIPESKTEKAGQPSASPNGASPRR